MSREDQRSRPDGPQGPASEPEPPEAPAAPREAEAAPAPETVDEEAARAAWAEAFDALSPADLAGEPDRRGASAADPVEPDAGADLAWADDPFGDRAAAVEAARDPSIAPPADAAPIPAAAPATAARPPRRRRLRLWPRRAEPSARPRAPGGAPVARAVTAGLALFAAAVIAIGVPTAATRYAAWRADAAVAARPPALGPLTRALIDAGLLRLAPDGLALSLAPADLALRRKLRGAPADPWPETLSPDAVALLEIAHGDGPGRALRAELADWRAGLAVAAIRDNQGGVWRAETIQGFADPAETVADLFAPAFPARAAPGLSVERFGFFGWSGAAAPAPTGDWTRAAPVEIASAGSLFGAGAAEAGLDVDSEQVRIRFVRAVRPDLAGGPLILDVLGAGVRVAGAVRLAERPLCRDPDADPAAAVDPPGSAGPAPAPTPAFAAADRPIARAPRGAAPDCAPGRADPDGVRLRVRPEGGPIAVTAVPHPNPPPALRAFAGAPLISRLPAGVAADPAAAGWTAYPGSEAYMLWCGVPRAEAAAIGPTCALAYAAPPPRPLAAPAGDAPIRRPRPAPQLQTADGVALTLRAEGGARATDAAAALGLADLVTPGAGDRLGLFAALAARPGATAPTRLTLRADWQAAARDALASARGGGPAVLIALDAGDDPARRGDLLALAVRGAGGRSPAPEPASAPAPAPALARAGDADAAAGDAWNARGYRLWRPAGRAADPIASALTAAADPADAPPAGDLLATSPSAPPGPAARALAALALTRAAVLREFDADLGLPRPGPLHRALIGIGGGVADELSAPGLPLPTGARLDPQGGLAPPDAPEGAELCRPDAPPGALCNAPTSASDGAGATPHRAGWRAPRDTGCPIRPGGSETAPQFGLCEAVAGGLDSWFAAAALGLSALDAGGPDAVRAAFAELAARFPRPRAADDPSGPAPIRLPPVSAAGRAPVERALAETFTGRALAAPPLALAALYGGVAAGCRLQPRILPRATAPAADCPPLLFPTGGGSEIAAKREAYARQWINGRLIPGLRAAANRGDGPVPRAFRDAPAALRAHAAAGAGADASGARADWLAGWAEIGAARRRIAFVCYVADAAPAAPAGEVCAPLARRFLDALSRAPETRP